MAVSTARRGPGGSGLAGPLALLTGLAALGAVWAGAAAGAALTGQAAPGNPVAYLVLLARGRAHWPGPWATGITAGLGMLLLTAAALVTVRLAAGSGTSPVRAAARHMARPRDLTGLVGKSALVRARQFRPSLAGQRTPAPAEVGVRLGRLMPTRTPVTAAFEDVLLAVMAPRSGKTTSLAVPAILDSPGPVVVTSNKADVVHLTAALRARAGPVWTFDAQAITGTDQQMWWNPLAAVRSIREARLLAAHFMQEVSPGGSNDDFWDRAGLRVLSSLLLAAGVSDGTLRDVWRWVNTPTDPDPARRLRAAGLHASAAGLEGTRAGAIETREGLYETVRAACACLEDDRILAWVTPPPAEPAPAPAPAPAPEATGVAGEAEPADGHEPGSDDDPDGEPGPESGEHPYTTGQAQGSEESDSAGRSGLPAWIAQFVPAEFVTSTGTVYLLSHSDAGAAQPLVAALADELLRAGIHTAQRRPNQRLDPPLLCVLDEAANVCKIRNLPELYSHLGSRSIVPITILQSYKQAELVWGATGAEVLWSAATIKLIGAGLDDPRLAEDLSRMIGDHDITTHTVNHGGGRNGHTRSVSVTRDRILSPADVRNIPKGWAVLLATGCPAGLLQLDPWYSGPRAAEITAAETAARAHLTDHPDPSAHPAADASADADPRAVGVPAETARR